MKTQPPSSTFFALFCTLFLVIFNYTLTLMAGIYIVGDLGGSNQTITYSITFYSLGNALGVPLGRPCGERKGILRMLIFFLVLFAIFSELCAVAPTYPVFLIFRFFQGLVSGPFYSLVNRLFAKWTPKEKVADFSWIIITIFTVGPVIGASIGGIIAYAWKWRLIFDLSLPLIFLVIILLWRERKEEICLMKTPFDWVGYLFYSLAVMTLGSAITLGQELDWFRSNLIIALTFIGFLSLVFFILWAIRHPYPILNFKLLKNFPFAFGLFSLLCLFSAYFGMVILIALWLNLEVKYTAQWVAILLGHMALAGIFPVFIVKKMSKLDSRIPLSIAILFFAASCFHTMLFDVEVNFGRIVFSRVLAGFGLAFFLPPLFRLCFHSHPKTCESDVVNLFQAVRALSSGLGAAIYSTVWYRREIFYHDRLGSKLTPLEPQVEIFNSLAKTFHLKGEKTILALEDLLNRQSVALALDDMFYLMALIMVGLFAIVLLSAAFKKEGFDPAETSPIE